MFKSGYSRLAAHVRPIAKARFASPIARSAANARFASSFVRPTVKAKFANSPSHKPKKDEDDTPLPIALAWATGIAAVVGFGYLYLTDASAGVHKHVFIPLLRLMDPENAHRLSIFLLKQGFSPLDEKPDDPLLEVELWGKRLSNPVGMAAGFDKNAEVFDGLYGLGFGFVEVGTITPAPQEGNPKQRLFRIDESGAVINRMGLNNDGVQVCGDRIRSRFWHLISCQSKKKNETISSLSSTIYRSVCNGQLLGVNLGKNKSSPADSYDDYVYGLQNLGPYADYVVINVSCPNVKNIAASSDIGVLESTIAAVLKERNNMEHYLPPIVLKIGPDNSSDQLQLIAQLALDYRVDGIITTNTTLSRPAGLIDPEDIARQEGGLSGKPLRDMALNTTREMYKLTKGKIPIIGCGGISSAEDALAFAKAGASAIQIYTSMTYDGPGKVREIKDGLVGLLKGRKWTDVIGEDERK
ncbi:dihydroorotate dehydrogenase [Coemansia sp. RSA 2399]|nr:dihydroorotate dehydrogenase [Coemansia sp. RSA 2399]